MTERDLEQSMKIDIKLDVFEGPLDLLLHLIEKNKVSIYDIPIVEITNQYMEYIREMEKTYSMESMSEFLVMAATLLKIKSKMHTTSLIKKALNKMQKISLIKRKTLPKINLIQQKVYFTMKTETHYLVYPLALAYLVLILLS